MFFTKKRNENKVISVGLLFDIDVVEKATGSLLYGRSSYDLLFKNIPLKFLAPTTSQNYALCSRDILINRKDCWLITIGAFPKNSSFVYDLMSAIILFGLIDYIESVSYMDGNILQYGVVEDGLISCQNYQNRSIFTYTDLEGNNFGRGMGIKSFESVYGSFQCTV